MATGAGDTDIPGDMVEEIMSMMEPTDLCRYKTVSKGLNQMISSKPFIKKQLQKMKELNRLVFILQPEFCFVPLFYDNLEIHAQTNGRMITLDDNYSEMVASSNGLLLFCNLADEFFLMNPSINKLHMLPTKKIVFPEGCSWAQVFFGMGYIGDENDYKVVRIALFNSPTLNTEVMIYSRNFGMWKKGPVFPDDFPMAHPGVYIHGRLHWRSAVFLSQNSVSYFNLEIGEYGSMSIPGVPLMFGMQQLVALDENTLVLSSSVLYLGGPYVLWILKDYFDPTSWTKIQINTSTIMWSDTIINLQPLSILRPTLSKILFRLDPNGMFGLYDMKLNEFSLIDAEETHEGFCTVYGFVPCLHSPSPVEMN